MPDFKADGSTSHTQSSLTHTNSSPTDILEVERVKKAQSRLGRQIGTGTPTLGEWIRSDGWSVQVKSGDADRYHDSAVRFIKSQNWPRPAIRLARHTEMKIAVAIHEEAMDTDQVVTIDREVCGTRDYDKDKEFTCDKYLSRALPSGVTMHVVQPDGTVRIYKGEDRQ